MIKIHSYTATWDAAMLGKPKIRVGSLVKIHQDPDARELDSFRSHLAICGKKAEKFIRSVGKFDLYMIKLA